MGNPWTKIRRGNTAPAANDEQGPSPSEINPANNDTEAGLIDNDVAPAAAAVHYPDAIDGSLVG